MPVRPGLVLARPSLDSSSLDSSSPDAFSVDSSSPDVSSDDVSSFSASSVDVSSLMQPLLPPGRSCETGFGTTRTYSGTVRTVVGPTDRVVVVGAGLAGLSAALRLAGAGRQVTMLERESVPGGRNGLSVHEVDGGRYAFDTGPTVLTMPDLLRDAFDCVGQRLEDHLELTPVDPLYRAHYPDGSVLDVKADPAAMAAEIERVCGPEEAGGYQRFVEFVSKLYALEMRDFIDRNFDSPFDLMRPSLARLVAIGGMRKLAPKVNQYLKDPRTQRVLSFQAMYAGLAPQDALAIYAVIAYMDSVAGVYFPKGGMHAVPRALAAAAEKAGVEIRLNTEVTSIETRGHRAVAVCTADGERIPADTVVLTPDLPVAYRDLLPPTTAPRRLADRWHRPVDKLSYSPSCFLLLAGSKQNYSQIGHHNIHFGRAWKRTFREIIDRGELMSDPVDPRHQPDAQRPRPGPGRQAHLLRAVPDAEPRRPDRLGRDRPALPRRGRRHAGAARLHRVRRRHRGRGDHHPGRLAGTRPGARRSLRGRALLRPDGTVPTRQPRRGLRERRLRRVGHGARRRGADGAALGSAGRRADPRPRPQLPQPRLARLISPCEGARRALRRTTPRHREGRRDPGPDGGANR